MNVTREVIIDLWPLYVEGEASADTRALVEAFLQQDPDFVRLLQERDVKPLLEHAATVRPPDLKAQALARTKRSLYGWDRLFFPAILFTCLAFGRIVSDTSWNVSPVNFIVIATIAATFWVAFLARVIWVRRRVFRAPVSGERPRS